MPLGCSSVEVSALGLGTAAIGGLYTPVTPDEAAAVVLAALDAGITYFDTAPLYGLGESERRLGRALVGVDRSGLTISTKVGRLIEPSSAGGGTDVFAGVDRPTSSSTSAPRVCTARSRRASSGSASTASTSCSCTIRRPRRSGDRRDLPGAGALARRGCRRRSASA